MASDVDLADAVPRLVDAAVGKAPGTVKRADKLDDLDGWDSLAVIQYLAGLDEKCGIRMPAGQMYKLQTVDDLIAAAEAARKPAGG